MPPRHLHNHPRHSLLLALTNDRRLGKTRHLYWDIWQGHNLCPLQRRSAHTGSFVCLCQAELRVEISLPQQLTSASCFLFPWPPLRPSCLSLFGQTETDPVLIVVVMLLQWGAVSKSTLNQVLNDQALQRLDGGECPSQTKSSAPRSASMGTRATTKKTVSFSQNNSFLQASDSFSEIRIIQAVCDTIHGNLHTVLLSSSHLKAELLNS